MSLSAHAAAGLVLGGVPARAADSPLSPGSASLELIASYAASGIRSFLFPGDLAREPGLLAELAEAARRATEEAGLGRALVAVGGKARPGFGLPFFPAAPSPLGLASLGSAAAAGRAGRLVGLSLAACGADLVMGPRLDLASDPKDPAGALDGFGEDSRLAGILGAAYARGLARAGLRRKIKKKCGKNKKRK